MNRRQWIYSLSHPTVRDLAWSLLCPPLCRFGAAPDPCATDKGLRSRIESLDADPAPLIDFLAQHPTSRLGVYYELLLFYYLRHHPELRHARRGIALRADGVTLGELDFLYLPKGDLSYTHLEVAFKFFLRLSPGCSPALWLGPNPKDSFDRKIDRMVLHQLPLSGSENAKRLLGDRYPVGRRLGWIKGCLFYPWDEFNAVPVAPLSTCPNHWRGWWLRETALSRLNPGGAYLPLERGEWLTPRLELDSHRLTGVEMLGAQDGRKPRMVARMEKQGERWQETDRGFILPRSWPDTD